MLKYSWLIIIAMFLFVGACGSFQTDYPQLEVGIHLSKSYKDLHRQYEDIYERVDAEVQKDMREEIAPKLNAVKRNIIRYNEVVLVEGDTEDMRKSIIDDLRDIAMELSKVKEDDNE